MRPNNNNNNKLQYNSRSLSFWSSSSFLVLLLVILPLVVISVFVFALGPNIASPTLSSLLQWQVRFSGYSYSSLASSSVLESSTPPASSSNIVNGSSSGFFVANESIQLVKFCFFIQVTYFGFVTASLMFFWLYDIASLVGARTREIEA